ncbi:MAG: excinuclease ABC subunit UvrC [Pseudomonadota bacterium]
MSEHFDVKAFLETLTRRPGVYRMLGDRDEVLYVGKAKDLRRRVGSYFSRSQNLRIQRLVSQIRDIQVTVTNTEAEALLLENHVIKAQQPRYNVLLKDDKSYPYIFLSAGAFPRLAFHRGARSAKGRFFGPYPSARAVRETLSLLQKVFPVRQCEDSFFRNRSRPCLQYQIKRCSGPCVGLVSEAEYARDVQDTRDFLQGRTSEVIDGLADRMDGTAAELAFEKAAGYRDRIAALRRIQERQYVSGEKGDLDIVAAAVRRGRACVQLFLVRGGRNLGNKTFFPRSDGRAGLADVISAFLAQHYLERPVPAEVLVSQLPGDRELLEEVLSTQEGRRVRIRSRLRGERLRWMRMAQRNADLALASRLGSHRALQERFEALQESLGLDEVPARIECFDISHTGGEKTVASCVVFNREGPLKSAYRRFNMREAAAGDDYAAMAEALRRRYGRIRREEGELPDLVLVDGGAGQLGAAAEVLQELGLPSLNLAGIAKGSDRRAGQETLFLYGQSTPFILAPDSPALHLMQQVRDEAHRFAVTGHRQRRGRARQRSVLEDIPGIGPKRRQVLLRQFGGLQELGRAGVEDIAGVEGFNHELAERVYAALHDD